jgi:hypothetical protein
MRLRLFFVIVACCPAWYARPAHACRYNVREVGFIDVGIEAYRFLMYVGANTPPDEMVKLREAADATLVDTNVKPELVRVGADANLPALEFLASCHIDSFPAAVLVSPDGQARALALPHPRGAGAKDVSPLRAKAVCSTLEGVLHSPTRQRILEAAADNYAVVLLMEGPEPQPNAAAREAVAEAIGSIKEQLEYFPKPIARPPALVVLERSALAREEILLWTLGLKPEDVNQPCAAVFYGRGRWIGPLFKGDLLSSDRLAGLLSVVGADCECGLDHRVLQGTMLPARWDEALRQKTAESLGFDPESPMVKMEMVSIVRRGMGGFDYPGVPFGYEEIQVGADEEEPMTADAGTLPILKEEKPPSAIMSSRTEVRDRNPHLVGILGLSLGGMTVLVAAASVWILRRARKT